MDLRSKPAAPGVQVVIKDAGSTAVRTLDAVQRGAEPNAAWDGGRSDGEHAQVVQAAVITDPLMSVASG